MRLIAICLTLISVVIAGPCPPAGYPYPPPTNISRGSIIDQAAANLTLTLNTVLANSSILPYLDTNSTSFSIDVYHAQHNRSILTFHHTAPSLSQSNLGVKKVDSDTVYRIASISKLWTVYTYLVTIGDTSFYDPITKYIPELATYVEQHPVGTNNKNISIDVFDWAQMTISSLISHLAGVPQDPGLSPLVDAGFASAGLPKVPPVNGSFCGDPAILQWPCDRAGKLSTPKNSSHSNFFGSIFPKHPIPTSCLSSLSISHIPRHWFYTRSIRTRKHHQHTISSTFPRQLHQQTQTQLNLLLSTTNQLLFHYSHERLDKLVLCRPPRRCSSWRLL